MSADLLASLLLRLGAATCMFTLLAGLLIALRRPLRARLGAAAVYALWLALPIGLMLCCLPRHEVAAPAIASAMAPAATFALTVDAALPAARIDYAPMILLVWMAGAIAGGAMQALRQRALLRALGPLRPGPGGAWLSMRPDAGPLLVGLLHPRIVVPADFEQRYDAAEQAAVLGSGLHAPRAYANALLKTMTTASLPVGCTMQAISPIKERIMHLQDHVSPRRARIGIAAALAGFTVAGASLGWAATGEAAAAAGNGQYRLALDLSVDGGPARHQEVLTAGTHHVAGLRDGEGHDCEADIALTEGAGATVSVQMQLVCDGKPAAAPRMEAKLGEAMTLAIGRNAKQADGSYLTVSGFRLSMKVDKA